MKIGDKININGVDLLILDFIDDDPFVLAYNLDDVSIFSNKNNCYSTSILRSNIENWFCSTEIIAIPRLINLKAMDGYDKFGKLRCEVAPLTFDEYRKYNYLIKKNIKRDFWTATPWCGPNEDIWGGKSVCYVNHTGTASVNTYSGSFGLAPAFILSNKKYSIEQFTTDELLEEIRRRTKT